MKKPFSLLAALAALAVCVSCSAMPPATKNFKLAATAPGTNTPPITGVNFYYANFANTNWTLAATSAATNGQTVTVPLPPGQIWTCDSTNRLTGTSSDYAPAVTNTIPSAPVNLEKQ